jgi:hypothetical protein
MKRLEKKRLAQIQAIKEYSGTEHGRKIIPFATHINVKLPE